MSDAKRLADRLRFLSELAREFSATTDDYDALLSLIAGRLSATFGDLCVIRLVSADGLFLEPTSAIHHPDAEVVALAKEAAATNPQRMGEGITGTVAVTGRPVLIPVVDLAKLVANLDPGRRSVVERQRITSLVVAPLLMRGRVIGVASLTRSDPERPFDEDDLAFLEDVAAHAALAIANARSYAAERAALLAALKANHALHESENAHRLLFEASPVPLFVFDVETLAPIAVNQAALLLYGYTHDEFMRLQVTDLALVGQESARVTLASWGDAESAGTARYRRADGSQFVAEYTTRALMFGGRRARIAVVKDITERQEAERTRALLAAIVESSNDAIVSKQLDGTVTSWNGAAERLFGYSAEEIRGKSIALIVPPDRIDEERKLIGRVAAGERTDHHETVRLHKDGTQVVVSISIAPILDSSGRVVGASKTARDLTAQRRAAAALQRIEEQLRQSQKMEAVGRLAGGIAHDFNNVLSVILSYSEMILGGLQSGDPASADIGEIHRAAARAADLTRQLLMFSRQQVIEPKVLDLNQIVSGMDKMLRRVLGEDVDLVFEPSPRLGKIRADASNVEQVIMNLVVNARDAIPTGGKVTIRTADVLLDAAYAGEHLGASVGPHVMLAICDNGVGMDEATQARIFEPFFTTKGSGKGTGLGLSTVFGIAQQCGGSVRARSAPGEGATFEVYFPLVEAPPDDSVTPPPPLSMRGSETILLVEDQEQVRAVACGILRRNGYRVLAAGDPYEALALGSKQPGTVHLLVVDVVMPQMSGAELAKRLAAARPEAKVLFMSGYTDDSVARHGVLEQGFAFLQKPFTPESLARKVREVLNAPRGG